MEIPNQPSDLLKITGPLICNNLSQLMAGTCHQLTFYKTGTSLMKNVKCHSTGTAYIAQYISALNL